MAEQKHRRIVVPDAPATAFSSRFSRYNPEEEKPVRKIEVVENEAMKAMKDAWNSFKYHGERDSAYEKALAAVKGLSYSAKEVENFSIIITEFPYEQNFHSKAGLFLSALMNSGKDSDYTIQAWSMAAKIGFLCYKNTKNVTVKGGAGVGCGWSMEKGSIKVEGDAGNLCGHGMKDGTITVEGNAGRDCGHGMENGSITVNGNAGNCCGHNLKSGTITVEGDAGYNCGFKMKGGTITVNGEMQSIAGDIDGGKIFHKGRLIADK